MKKPLLIGVSALVLLASATLLFAQTTTGSSLISEMKAAVRSFTLAADLNPGVTGIQSAPVAGKKTGDMLTAGEYNRILELVGQGGGGGGAGDSVPAGAVMAFNLSTCPSGWSPADGTGGRPDLRGEFIRGLDSGRGIDTGRTLGSSQGDALKSHQHSVVEMIGDNNVDGVDSTVTQSGDHHNEGRQTGLTGGTETRPRNIALLYCVKGGDGGGTGSGSGSVIPIPPAAPAAPATQAISVTTAADYRVSASVSCPSGYRLDASTITDSGPFNLGTPLGSGRVTISGQGLICNSFMVGGGHGGTWTANTCSATCNK